MKKIQSYLQGKIVMSNDTEAFSLHKKSNFGEIVDNKIQYMLTETLYLVKKSQIEVLDGKMKPISFDTLLKKFKKIDNKIQIKYPVFKDLRDKGNIVKTALKFGAEFRVYTKGTRPGMAGKHARWIVFTDSESNKISWHELSAKTRVSHGTKKKLLLAIVDEESDVTYYEVDWVKV